MVTGPPRQRGAAVEKWTDTASRHARTNTEHTGGRRVILADGSTAMENEKP